MSYTKKDYIPIRRGPVYCAPFCGCSCTWEAFQQATKRAAALCGRLGDGWKPVVWENMGWHSKAVGAGGHMLVYIDMYGTRPTTYSAFLNTNRWSPGSS